MPQIIPTATAEADRGRIFERPDGFYWRDTADGSEYGPFATLIDAVADMQRAGEETLEPGEAIEPGETLEQAEDEIGMAGWIDPETGEPAEEGRPHIEEL